MAIPTQEDFIEAVLAQLRLKQTKLGEALGAANAYNTVHNWKIGKVRLTYADTMRMLEMCGWLAMQNGAKPAHQPKPPGDRLESIAAAVGEILQNQKEQLGLLQEIHEAPALRRTASRVPPKRKTG